MKNYIVCNVSDQTIPTILFIKEILSEKEIENIYFTVTSYSMKSLQNILSAYPEIENIHKSVILPSSDSIKDIKRELNDIFDSDKFSEARFFVDITCGTKIMSIGLYEFFKEFSSEIFYINRRSKMSL